MMFLIMVRVSDPLVPRAIFGMLNTVLYFPSGAVYPTQSFPAWMKRPSPSLTRSPMRCMVQGSSS
jgi:hypothetical protein